MGAGCAPTVFLALVLCFEQLDAGCNFRAPHPSWDAPRFAMNLCPKTVRIASGNPVCVKDPPKTAEIRARIGLRVHEQVCFELRSEHDPS